MKLFTAFLAALLFATPALAAEKRVFRIDSLIATQQDGIILLQAKGAVDTGGWTKPRLHVMHADRRILTLEFLAPAPPPGLTVLDALLPVMATVQVKSR